MSFVSSSVAAAGVGVQMLALLLPLSSYLPLLVASTTQDPANSDWVPPDYWINGRSGTGLGTEDKEEVPLMEGEGA